MLPIDQITPYIRHEDPWVVDLALQCLEWVRWPKRLTSDFVLDAIREGHTQLSRWLAHFPPSGAVLDYAITILREQRADNDAIWPYAVIDRASDELLTEQVLEALKTVPSPFPVYATNLHSRQEAMHLTTETVRARFLEACAAADENGTAMSDQREIRVLADRLVYRGDVAWSEVQFREQVGSDSWAETWLLAVLIKCRNRAAMGLALDRFGTTSPEENEALTHQLSFAIAELAAPQDLPRIVSLWESSDRDKRSYIMEGVGHLRFPEAEPVLLNFARSSEDATDKTMGAVGLCEMLSTSEESRQFIAGMIEREEFDVTFADLEQVAVPLGIIQGLPFPNETEWRKRLSDPNARTARRRALFREKHGDWADVFERLRSVAQENRQSPLREPSRLSTGDEPVRLTRAKTVGRNDPCPCGSGKKYKKCCLRES